MKGKYLIFLLAVTLPLAGCRDRFFYIDVAASDAVYAGIRAQWDTLSDEASRSACLLQMGRPVCDIAIWYGEDSLANASACPVEIPYGFNASPIETDELLHHAHVRHGLLVTDNCRTYKALYLAEPAETLSLDLLRALASFADQGAVIGGVKPVAPADSSDAESFLRLVEKTWSTGNAISGKTLESVLRAVGAIPDMKTKVDSLAFAHRHLPDADIYRIVNPTSATVKKAKIRFRVSGRQPFRYDPDTGNVTPVSYKIKKGRTRITLPLYPYETVFIVFGPYADRRKMKVKPLS